MVIVGLYLHRNQIFPVEFHQEARRLMSPGLHGIGQSAIVAGCCTWDIHRHRSVFFSPEQWNAWFSAIKEPSKQETIGFDNPERVGSDWVRSLLVCDSESWAWSRAGISAGLFNFVSYLMERMNLLTYC
jgi:hypothetical protein